MKFLIINDNHQLYRQMYADVLSTNQYDVEEIKRMDKVKRNLLYRFAFSKKVNAHICVPFKGLWNKYYPLGRYPFKDGEKYAVIFLNGSIRKHFCPSFFKTFKRKHPNVKLILTVYDPINRMNSKQTIKMLKYFDTIYSYDEEDCNRYGFERIYQTFSKPSFVYNDIKKYSSVFFAGGILKREKLLKATIKKISENIEKCKFYITGVREPEKIKIKNVVCNQRIPFHEEIQMSFNTDCILEIVREGSHGITLRACEAIMFEKKLLTNCENIKSMPFYNPRYIRVFSSPEDIDMDFISKPMEVKYSNQDCLSPLNILKRIEAKYG